MIYRAICPGDPALFGGEFQNDEVPTITVYESEDASPTGLLDASGVPIYRIRERVKVGFVP